MKLASIAYAGREAAARLTDSGLVLLPYRDVGELLVHEGWRELAAADPDPAEVVPVDQVAFRPVIPRPDKIVCLGRNYAEHVHETGNEMPEHPTLFPKYRASLTGAYDDVAMPSASDKLDWEAEMALVIGVAGRNIAKEDALEHVAGYTLSQDLSVRDWQRHTQQWLPGKAWEALTPLGPYLVTDDELPPGGSGLEIGCKVDGVVMQKSTTDKLIYDVPTVLAYISTIITLEPGDVILTGTPDGVGIARDPKVFLKPGQVLETWLEGVGELRNRVVE